MGMMGFQFFQVIWFVMFFAIGGFAVYTICKSISHNRKNDNSPRLMVEATVVTKRTHVWGDHSRTEYFVTFQVASGDRMELEIQSNQFGYLVEGDRGKLTFQGTRFLGFERM